MSTLRIAATLLAALAIALATAGTAAADTPWTGGAPSSQFATAEAR
ncbi:MAG TPA: hypothetical protein VFX16_08255 [Pseudonocardiaceae bacterium]|nr:hypothetical protein [Pseudonocardiaceae bacterium]